MTQAQDASSSATPAAAEEKIITLPSGLKYVDIVEGTGATPQPGQRLSVNYVGTLEDGKKFDSSYDRGKPFKFYHSMNMVIRGWDEGVATMKVGGKRKLIIPPRLGYGTAGFGDLIPPNSTLTFVIELIAVENPPNP
jgi:peptidylprolyl isomerase